MLALLLAALLDPRTAAVVGATIAGHPGYAPQLVEICERESLCSAIGVHPDDAGRSRSAWAMAVGVGKLDPTCQPHRRHAWSTRGAYGTMAAFTVSHLGECLPPWVLDVPLLAAIAATRRAHAPECRQVRGCRRWGWA